MQKNKRSKTLVDSYKDFQESGDNVYKVNKDVYRNICIEFNEMLIDYIVLDSGEIAVGASGTGNPTAESLTGTIRSYTKPQRGALSDLTSNTSITIDMAVSNNFKVTLDHDATFQNPSNDDAPGQSGSIFITQGSTGGTGSFGTDWDFAGGTAPTLSSGSGKVDRIDYIVLDATNIHAVATLDYS